MFLNKYYDWDVNKITRLGVKSEIRAVTYDFYAKKFKKKFFFFRNSFCWLIVIILCYAYAWIFHRFFFLITYSTLCNKWNIPSLEINIIAQNVAIGK